MNGHMTVRQGPKSMLQLPADQQLKGQPTNFLAKSQTQGSEPTNFNLQKGVYA